MLLSHCTEQDPIFNYANKTGQQLWELGWDEFTKMPSRLSAEPVRQKNRIALLEEVRRSGFVSGYEGIRISRTGRRFRILNATVWNVLDEQNMFKGQAVVFERWAYVCITNEQ